MGCTQSLPNIFSLFTMEVSNAKFSKGVWAVFVKPLFKADLYYFFC